MTIVYDVRAQDLIKVVSDKLKTYDSLVAPEWTKYVKTGAHVERPPEQSDWWYTRLAAILRSLYIKGPVGVERLRTKFGARRKRRYGYAPKQHVKAGGKLIRTALQMLEAEGLVELVKGKGRKLTPQGKSLLDKLAGELA